MAFPVLVRIHAMAMVIRTCVLRAHDAARHPRGRFGWEVMHRKEHRYQSSEGGDKVKQAHGKKRHSVA